jgi:hypothetical protein
MMFCQLKKNKIGCSTLGIYLMRGLLVLLPTVALATQSVTFGWDSSTDPSVVGYNIYYGTVSHVYTNKISVGNVTSATIPSLTEGITYYFAATTDDALNQESGLSDEISYTVPALATNPPPAIMGISNLNATITSQSVTFSLSASGTGPLSYSLDASAPPGAWINPTNGVFHWSPQIQQASTTNLIAVIVTDSGNPPQSSTQIVTVVVQDYVGVSLGSTVVATNSTGGVPLTVYASTPITNLEFNLTYPPGRLTNFSIVFSSPLVGVATITPIVPGQALIAVGASAGNSLSGLQSLGSITFNSIAEQKTAVAYLQTDTPLALRADGSPANFTVAGQGRVTIVGRDSMVEAQQIAGVRSLIVYGLLGASYQVQSCNALGSGSWYDTAMAVSMTNLSQTFQLPPDTNPATFYRTKQTP